MFRIQEKGRMSRNQMQVKRRKRSMERTHINEHVCGDFDMRLQWSMLAGHTITISHLLILTSMGKLLLIRENYAWHIRCNLYTGYCLLHTAMFTFLKTLKCSNYDKLKGKIHFAWKFYKFAIKWKGDTWSHFFFLVYLTLTLLLWNVNARC